MLIKKIVAGMMLMSFILISLFQMETVLCNYFRRFESEILLQMSLLIGIDALAGVNLIYLFRNRRVSNIQNIPNFQKRREPAQIQTALNLPTLSLRFAEGFVAGYLRPSKDQKLSASEIISELIMK